MPGVRVVEKYAFFGCEALTDVDCDKLERIGRSAFYRCKSLRSINLPFVETVEVATFTGCINLVDVTFGDKLESIGEVNWGAFCDCHALKRITIPLKDGMITHDDVIYTTHNEISDDLHTSRVVISRLLKKLENEGKIKLFRNSIKVLVL